MKTTLYSVAAIAATLAIVPLVLAGDLFEVKGAPASATVGAKEKTPLTLSAKNGWHVNEQAPIPVKLAAGTGITLDKAKLTRADLAETTKDKVSYAIGMNVGMSLKKAGFDVDTAIIAAAMNDALKGNPPALSQEEAGTIMRAYQQEMAAKQQEKAKEASSKVREAGTAYLAANAKKDGVKTTASGLQYKFIWIMKYVI